MTAVTRYIAAETAIGVVVNIALGAVFTLLLFSGGVPALWGVGGLVFTFLPATFLPVAAMTIGMTAITRRRRQTGSAPAIPGRSRGLPDNLVLRSILLGTAATVVLGGIGTAALLALWKPATSFAALFAFELTYAAIVGLVMAPLIVTTALRDPIDRQNPGRK